MGWEREVSYGSSYFFWFCVVEWVWCGLCLVVDLEVDEWRVQCILPQVVRNWCWLRMGSSLKLVVRLGFGSEFWHWRFGGIVGNAVMVDSKLGLEVCVFTACVWAVSLGVWLRFGVVLVRLFS